MPFKALQTSPLLGVIKCLRTRDSLSSLNPLLHLMLIFLTEGSTTMDLNRYYINILMRFHAKHSALYSAHTSTDRAANKASQANKARCFLTCSPWKESLWLFKTFIKQLIMLPIYRNTSTCLDSFLALRKVLTKQNKTKNRRYPEKAGIFPLLRAWPLDISTHLLFSQMHIPF